MKTSPLYSLDLADLGKGFIIAVVTAILGIPETLLISATHSINWTYVAGVAVSAAIAYLGKNFFTKANIVLPPEAVAVATSVVLPAITNQIEDIIKPTTEVLPPVVKPEPVEVSQIIKLPIVGDGTIKSTISDPTPITLNPEVKEEKPIGITGPTTTNIS